MAVQTEVKAPGPRHATDRERRFRGDVEGLRAIAIGLVLLYHAGLPFLPGGYAGVDVFFVISGFLITSQLVGELDRTGTVSLRKFYARRAKRLLPAAAVVLAVTVVLVRLFVPRTRWEEIGGDIIGSALYVVNWRLADRSVDYLAEDSQASPVQHFWSLAVEEQYYLVWPLLILLAAGAASLLARRRPALSPATGTVAGPAGPAPGARRALWLGLAVVAVPSFAWALLETARAPERAFFVTTTRMWELAIGAALALGAGWLARLPVRLAVPLGWTGLVAIAVSGLSYSTSTAWPGYAALLPTLGAAAVIAAGFAAGRAGPEWLLGTAPFRWVGGLSYSLYLWHWPLLAVAAVYWDGLSVPAQLAVALLSIVPAWLTYRMVENPLRHSPAISRSPRLALSLGACFTLAGVVAGLALLLSISTAVPGRDDPPDGQRALGAEVLADEPRDDPAGAPVDEVDWMTPDPLEATEDVPGIYDDGCQQGFDESEVLSCEYGDENSDFTVAVAGDSKIVQWLSALEPLADHNGWRLVTYTKSNCGFHSALSTENGEPYHTCQEWNASLLEQLLADPPDYLLTSQRAARALDGSGEPSVDAMVAGLQNVWSQLVAAGTEIVVVADNPSPDMNVYECVDENREQLTRCTYDRSLYGTNSAAPTQWRAVAEQSGLAADAAPEPLVVGESGLHFVDMFDAICPTQRCAPVIGNVLIYRQGSHITATYIETLTPRLAAALSDVGMPAEMPG